MNSKLVLLASALVIIVTIFYSCKPKKENETQEIDPSKIQLGPIVHNELTEEQIEKIKKIQSSLADVLPISLEETITNFKRDRNPDNEINIWLEMLSAYEKFISKEGNEITLNKKTEVFQLILMRSMMDEQEAIAKVDCKILTKNEIKEIFSYYQTKPKPLSIEKR
jgi:hypothetical protein